MTVAVPIAFLQEYFKYNPYPLPIIGLIAVLLYLGFFITSDTFIKLAKTFYKRSHMLSLVIFIITFAFTGAVLGAAEWYAICRSQEHISSLTPLPSSKPEIKVLIFSKPMDLVYKYPLQQYILSISNANINSATVFDCRIEFFFKNQIVKTKSMPFLNAGSMTSGFEMHVENKDGSISSLEEQPVETSITKKFSLVVQQDKVNGKIVNTNMAIFDCEKWPETGFFGANIVIDLSSKAVFAHRGQSNTYKGTYHYESNGQKYSESVQGLIKETEKIK